MRWAGWRAAAAVALVGVAAGVSAQHRGLVPWAWIMAAETTSDAATASHRPAPLANTLTPTASSLMSPVTCVAVFSEDGRATRRSSECDRLAYSRSG
ncbi:hypothetical protein I548_4186 [Mycobacterium intracellulare]|nr:hypothetical protein I548_4186 [Mycobacterium intracellulare]